MFEGKGKKAKWKIKLKIVESSWVGLVWAGRLILKENESTTLSPPSSWLQENMNQTSQCPRRAVTPGTGMAFPSVHPLKGPVSPVSSNWPWRKREAGKRNRAPEIGSLEENMWPLMLEAFNSPRTPQKRSVLACDVCVPGIR